jgi:ribosomal protein S3AE
MADEKVEEKKEEKAEERKEEDKQKKAATAKMLKGKNWYSIVSPALFGEKPLGEALASDGALLAGRKVNAGLMELTGDPSRYYMTLRFMVKDISGNVARTVFDGHECTRDFVARIVQHRTQRIDTNNVIQFKDGRLRVKAVAICNRRVNESVAKAVQKRIIEMVTASSEKTVEDFVKSFISGELQNGVRADVNRIYPLRAFEITKTDVL